MYRRFLEKPLRAAMADTPVVLLKGARQTGKSTLARQLCQGDRGFRYLSLDDVTILAAAREDPAGFVAGLEGPVVIDEIQRAPELLLAIKGEVDRDRRPGRFVLTGSADVMVSPRLSETLAGRMEIQTLWPLSQGEIEGLPERFVDALFAPRLPALAIGGQGTTIIERVLRGGFPEALTRAAEARRAAWYRAYVTTVLERDVRDLAQIEGLTAMPALLSTLAARATGLLNIADLSRTAGLPQTTLKRYLALFRGTFQVLELPAWSTNLGKRLQKSPKVLLSDCGLLAHLRGVGASRVEADRHLLGPLLENFVALEILKQLAWSDARPSLHHFRTQGGAEVALVLEEPSGRLVGVETKAAATVTPGDFAGLRALQEMAPDRFHRGVVLYAGSAVVPVAGNLHALPVEALWTLGT